MKTVTTRVPVRADLAGGTLDLWPLYLFHPASRTVNVAISFHAECEVSRTNESGIELRLEDAQYQRHYDTIGELLQDPHASLIARAVEHFKLTGLKITTRTDVPRGSGLGGSSAMAIALVRALSDIADDPVEGDQLIALVRDLETRLLKSPAGVQDYYPPVYGGLASLRLMPGAVTRVPLRLSLPELSQHFILHYSEVAHFSGTNNWEIFKRHIDGDQKVFDCLRQISEISEEMERTLQAGDLPGAGKALQQEWEARKRLVDGVSTPEIDLAVNSALQAGAWGAKVCGAGGGGCIVFLTPADRRKKIIETLRSVPGRTLDAIPVPYGLDVVNDPQKQVTFSFTEKPARPRGEPIEQHYLVSRASGNYQPYALVEGAIAFRDARHGTNVTVARSLIAPINEREQRVEWENSITTNPEKLQVTAIPDAEREFSIRPESDVLRSITFEGVESFRQYLKDSERLTLLHNPELEMYSEPGETKDEFIQRCMDESIKELTTETDRLERTFRRRIDQMIQKEDREQREIDELDAPPDESHNEVNIAWGQTLYDITSGKKSKRRGVASSPREGDYLDEISTIKRSWDRELEAVKEKTSEKAQQIEEITLVPSRRNIDIRKYVLLWAPAAALLYRPTKRPSRRKVTSTRRA
ncbi:MAG: hypothetical protein ABI718_09535 [Acidobacteriota bacterium]